jgi:hypothetical protein
VANAGYPEVLEGGTTGSHCSEDFFAYIIDVAGLNTSKMHESAKTVQRLWQPRRGNMLLASALRRDTCRKNGAR